LPITDQTEIEFHSAPKYGNGFERVIIHPREYANFKARMATALIERWGLVAGIEDGEDSAGRAKFRKATVAELVQEAVATADRAVEEFRARGWMIEAPELKQSDDDK